MIDTEIELTQLDYQLLSNNGLRDPILKCQSPRCGIILDLLNSNTIGSIKNATIKEFLLRGGCFCNLVLGGLPDNWSCPRVAYDCYWFTS